MKNSKIIARLYVVASIAWMTYFTNEYFIWPNIAYSLFKDIPRANPLAYDLSSLAVIIGPVIISGALIWAVRGFEKINH